VRTRSNLRHNSAIGLVRAVLPDHELRKDAPVAAHKRRCAVVAGGFEAEDHSHYAPGPLPDKGNLH
jgi:hypothetical protein